MTARPHSRATSSAAPPGATLLVFTLGAEAERRRKRLLPAGHRAPETALYRACLEEALEAGRTAGCRLEVSSPRPLDLPSDAAAAEQAGRGFGPRFAHAFDAALERTGSSGPVVAVGTDTPGLTTSHVAQALSLLRWPGREASADGDPRPRAVLGPSPDGGFYLLAADRPLGPILRRVRWCRSTTLAHLRRLLEGAGFEVRLLEPLADLDRRPDLERWLARRPARSVGAAGRPTEHSAAVLSRLLAALRRAPVPPTATIPRCDHLPVRRGRAPPALPPAA